MTQIAKQALHIYSFKCQKDKRRSFIINFSWETSNKKSSNQQCINSLSHQNMQVLPHLLCHSYRDSTTIMPYFSWHTLPHDRHPLDQSRCFLCPKELPYLHGINRWDKHSTKPQLTEGLKRKVWNKRTKSERKDQLKSSTEEIF